MIEGYRPLMARLNAIGDTKGMAKALGLETVREAKIHVARKTGNTGRTIRIVGLTEDSVTVEARGAGPYLEHGTRPHIIRPRAGKTLRFPARGVGTTLAGRVRTGTVRKLGNAAYVFAKVVHHPGTKAQPFLIPAAKAAISHLGIGSVVERWNRAA
jgi:hypothetical protein